MAIFNKPDQQTDHQSKPRSTVISANTKIKGTITSGYSVNIDGRHIGIIDVKAAVNIGRSGNVEGEILANHLTVKGEFLGTADCDNIDILAGGKLRGKVISNHLSIDRDCSFEGESVKKTPIDSDTKNKPTTNIESRSKSNK